MKFIELFEAIKKKVVYRNGKRKVKKVTSKVGHKVISGKEVKMSQKEKRTRELAQRKGAKKRKASASKASRKRKITMKKRK